MLLKAAIWIIIGALVVVALFFIFEQGIKAFVPGMAADSTSRDSFHYLVENINKMKRGDEWTMPFSLKKGYVLKMGAMEEHEECDKNGCICFCGDLNCEMVFECKYFENKKFSDSLYIGDGKPVNLLIKVDDEGFVSLS